LKKYKIPDDQKTLKDIDRQVNLFRRISDEKLYRLEDQDSFTTPQQKLELDLQEKSRLAREKRTSDLKRERYISQIESDISKLDAKYTSSDFTKKALLAADKKMGLNNTNDNKPPHEQLEKYAFLERKKNVSYSREDNAHKEDVTKLSKKGLSKAQYINAWNHANQKEPFVIQVKDKFYLVTANVFEHEETKKPRVGYYKLELEGKDLASAVANAKALAKDINQIDAREDKTDKHSPLTQEDHTGYAKQSNNEDLGDRIAKRIEIDVVNKVLKAPCVNGGTQDFSQEDLYARGGPKPSQSANNNNQKNPKSKL
jgi:hypothetical protein